MDARLIDHMLTEVVCADIHQFYGVQRTAAQMRLGTSMRGLAVEFVEHLAVCERGLHAHACVLVRMPAERGVQLVKHAAARHKRLAGAALLAGAAEEDDRAGALSGFQKALDGNGRTETGCAEHVVPAAVAAFPARRTLFRHAAFLTQTGERVKFRQHTDDRTAGAEAARKGRGDPGKVFCDRKALAAQRTAIALGGVELGKGGFRIRPDIVRKVIEKLRFFVENRQKI